ncbi:hypothetical protein CAPTEDRAFT_202542 [Capitella teleta]|uniref:Uncharacterized protein n=1 Tax=Capitella teleta TaxID=283909 RepID=R7V4W8_CAPTE|nr:hypothetical protein CAPTEDRAFT_202542 [Capitella teleta]|eukprot:ELU13898.1 hypothetical protein CAPTEDRAFT_202542 [Capitella teleta]
MAESGGTCRIPRDPKFCNRREVAPGTSEDRRGVTPPLHSNCLTSLHGVSGAKEGSNAEGSAHKGGESTGRSKRAPELQWRRDSELAPEAIVALQLYQFSSLLNVHIERCEEESTIVGKGFDLRLALSTSFHTLRDRLVDNADAMRSDCKLPELFFSHLIACGFLPFQLGYGSLGYMHEQQVHFFPQRASESVIGPRDQRSWLFRVGQTVAHEEMIYVGSLTQTILEEAGGYVNVPKEVLRNQHLVRGKSRKGDGPYMGRCCRPPVHRNKGEDHATNG